MGWADIDLKIEKRLYRFVPLYLREARRCRKAKAHLASCIMFGSALEAALMLMVSAYSDEIPTNILPTKKGSPKPLLDWSLHELVIVARTCGWLPAKLDLDEEWDHKRAKIGDYAMVAKDVRNLVHPARLLEDMPTGRVANRHSRLVADTFEIAVDHLELQVHTSLRRHMKEEKQAKRAKNAGTSS